MQLVNETTLQVTTPPGAGGANVAVRVVADGIEAAGSASFHYDDATAPVVTGAATGPASANGEWFTGQAQVVWTIVDPESAIVSTSGCEAVTITEDTTGAGRTFTCSATSEGGTSSASVTVKRDATPPTARVLAPAGIFEPGASAVVDYVCEDALSGVARCEGPIASGSTQTMNGAAGTYEFEVIAADHAGHQTTVLAPYAIATGVCIVPATQPLASWWTADQTVFEGVEGVGGIEPVTVAYAAGRVGQAFLFDGSSVLNFAGDRGDLSGNRSLALWINPSSSTSEEPRVIVSRATSYAFALFPDRTLAYRLSESAAWTRTNVRVEADRWTHLAMVLTVVSGDTQVQVYRDGRLEDTQTITGSVVNGGGALTFGGALPSGGTAAAPSFAGLLDELQVFSAPLDADAVRALALAGSKGVCRPVAITWSAAAPLVYGTPLGAAQLNATANVPGTFVYTPAAGTVLAAGEHMLNVTFTPADGTTHDSAAAKTVVQVTPAPLTIRAVDALKLFGAPIPAFTAVGEGFVNGDTLASLGGTLSFATTATSASAVGTYPVVPSGLSSANYTITWAPGTLTIQQANTTTTLCGFIVAVRIERTGDVHRACARRCAWRWRGDGNDRVLERRDSARPRGAGERRSEPHDRRPRLWLEDHHGAVRRRCLVPDEHGYADAHRRHVVAVDVDSADGIAESGIGGADDHAERDGQPVRWRGHRDGAVLQRRHAAGRIGDRERCGEARRSRRSPRARTASPRCMSAPRTCRRVSRRSWR